ncbi:MAG: hypothetical protein GXP08_02030, partial [Gammaproteobacteria bacterium]|nr:hypothetical protein [Gammaproteobacteria bacterium]
MFIRLRSQAGLFDLIPQAFSVTDTRLTFADTDSAARFLAQFRDDALAMARLKDLHDHIGTIARVNDRLDDDALIQQLAAAISGLSGGAVAVIQRDVTPQEAHSHRGQSIVSAGEFIRPQELPSRAITPAERQRWAETAETNPVETQQYKIVIEVAGKDLKPLNGHLTLRPTPEKDDYRRDLYPHQDTGQDAHRVELRFDNVPNKPRQLYYTIGTLHLPLCRNITPVEREAQASQWPNVLIPIIPICRYPIPDDSEPSADLITALPPGWLYVYLNGYLWREVQVERHAGVLRDVDLAAHPGKHPRPATGPWFELLLVPHK